MENPVVQNKKGGDAVASAEDDVGVNALLRENYKEDEDVPAAQALTLLVTGWSRYGLVQRTMYHFDCMLKSDMVLPPEVTAPASNLVQAEKFDDVRTDREENDVEMFGSPSCCGVVKILECVPMLPLSVKLTKKQRKGLRNRLMEFNSQAEKSYKISYQNATDGLGCVETSNVYEPDGTMPLSVIPSTRVAFCYEVTRIVLCVDASAAMTYSNPPSLVSKDSDGQNIFCPIDGLSKMVKTYLSALVLPVALSNEVRRWKPSLAITVIAVYPSICVESDNLNQCNDVSVLVKNYRIFDELSVSSLCEQIETWALSELENGISKRLSKYVYESKNSFGSSSLVRMLKASEAALDTLPSEARPIVCVVSCCSVDCDQASDILKSPSWRDISVHCLDLATQRNYWRSEPGYRKNLPIEFSDGRESLYNICEMTSGCYFNKSLLEEASHSRAGHISTSSRLHADPFLASRRRSVQANAVQWYTLFCVSPLTPVSGSTVGRLPPPEFLKNLVFPSAETPRSRSRFHCRDDTTTSLSLIASSANAAQPLGSNIQSHKAEQTGGGAAMYTYTLPLIAVKGILSQRCKEGFKTRKYGSYTWDPNKFSIHLALAVGADYTVHYEASFEASSHNCRQVGRARCRIYLSRYSVRTSLKTRENDYNSALNKLARSIKEADLIEGYLCCEKAFSISPTFLSQLEHLVAKDYFPRHFRTEYFEVLFPERFLSLEDDSLGGIDILPTVLTSLIEDFSACIVSERGIYLKVLPNRYSIMGYCMITVTPCLHTRRLFSICVGFFAVDTRESQLILFDLQRRITRKASAIILPRLISASLRASSAGKHSALNCPDNYCHCQSWELASDPELLPLVSRRRLEIGGFWLVSQDKDRILFAKFVYDQTNHVNGDISLPSNNLRLVKYEVDLSRRDCVLVTLKMDVANGHYFFQKSRRRKGKSSVRYPYDIFQTIFKTIKRRDLECGLALRSRSKLLSHCMQPCPKSTNVEDEIETEIIGDIERLLPYATCMTTQLRFFDNEMGEKANSFLFNLDADLLVPGSYDADIHLIGKADNVVWFLLVFAESDTLCLLRFPLSNEDLDEAGHSYRSLDFHTFGIGDLYSTRLDDDMTDDESNGDDQESTYRPILAIAERISVEHRYNLARAAYFALRSGNSDTDFLETDFEYATGTCIDTCVAESFVSLTNTCGASNLSFRDDSEVLPNLDVSHLRNIFSSLLKPVPIKDTASTNFFFDGQDMSDEKFNWEARDTVNREFLNRESFHDEYYISAFSNSDEEARSSNDDMDIEYEFNQDDSVDSRKSTVQDLPDPTVVLQFSEVRQNAPSPPLFVKIYLDNEITTMEGLSDIRKSVRVAVSVTTFTSGDAVNLRVNRNEGLPRLHYAFALALRSKLLSLTAAQQLERLRQTGRDISAIDLRTAMTCIVQAPDIIVTTKVPVRIFVRDKMCEASSATLGENEVVTAYKLIMSELNRGQFMTVKRATKASSYYIIPDNSDEKSLAYWAFIHIQSTEAKVAIAVYHPAGHGAAENVLDEVKIAWNKLMHRVNQLLLLENLHITRVASALLIPDDSQNEVASTSQSKLSTELSDTYSPPAQYGCDEVFRRRFNLNHRCEINKTILALGSSVLHQFAVANRRGFFVYRDEKENIVFMTLAGSDHVELVVKGVATPETSVTQQLCRLIEKELLGIALEHLSSLLTKNPYFDLKPADLDFLETYEYACQGSETSSSTNRNEFDYYFPKACVDPMLVLLYFRQNICGSTYFHRLQVSDRFDCESGQQSSLDYRTPAKTNMTSSSAAATVPFLSNMFSLFYINAPTPLNPEFQATSTLSSKGQNLSRHTGGGIALISFSLYRGDESLQTIPIGALPESEQLQSMPLISESDLLMERVNRGIALDDRFCVRVYIVNTTLNVDILHEWIELTLNQALSACAIEKHLMQSRRKLNKSNLNCIDDGFNKRLHIGIQSLYSMVQTAYTLPHPGVQLISSNKNIWTTSLATLTINILEDVLLGQLLGGDSALNRIHDIIIFRSSPESQFPRRVQILRKSKTEKAYVTSQNGETKERITDRPFDSPTYLLCFGLRVDPLGWAKPNTLLFPELVIEKGEVILSKLKSENVGIFSRSLSFILEVQKSSRKLYCYNFHPRVIQNISRRFFDAEQCAVKSEHRIRQLQQRHGLRSMHISDMTLDAKEKGEKEVVEREVPVRRKAPNQDLDLTTSKETVNSALTPTTGAEAVGSGRFRQLNSIEIRKPRLVGKSVKGSATQARLAARGRASTSIRGSSKQKKSSSAMTNSPSNASLGNSSHSQLEKDIKSKSSGKQSNSDPDKLNRNNSFTSARDAKELLSLHANDKSHSSNKMRTRDAARGSIMKDNSNQVSSDLLDISLSQGILLSTMSCRIPGGDVLGLSPRRAQYFIEYCRQYLSEKFDYSIISGNEFQDNISANRDITHFTTGSCLYMKKTLPAFSAAVIFEIALMVHTESGNCAARLRSWIVHNNESVHAECFKYGKFVRSEMLAKIIRVMLAQVHIDSICYLYSIDLLTGAKEVRLAALESIEVAHLGRCITKDYPLYRVKRLPRASTRIYEISLSLLTEAQGQHDLGRTNIGSLLRYASSNATRYGMRQCVGKHREKAVYFPVYGFEDEAMCLVTRDVDEPISTFKLFILCTIGDNLDLDSIVRIEDTVVAMMRWEFIAMTAKKMTMCTFLDVSDHLYRDLLWDSFVGASFPSSRRKHTVRAPTLHELKTLCRISTRTPLVTADVRLNDLLSGDDESDLKLDWHYLLSKVDLPLKRTTFFELEEGTPSIVYVFYSNGNGSNVASNDDDFFLVMEISREGRLKESILLSRDNATSNTTKKISRKQKVLTVEKFINSILDWIWKHTAFSF